jgi:hypothetical protein
MITRKELSVLGVGVVLAASLGASPAFADNSGNMPSGCSIRAAAPSTVSTKAGKAVTFGGSATCKSASSADFRLVHNFDGLPDSRVKNINIRQNGTGEFSYTGNTCDGGGSDQYYSEIKLYATGSPQRVSKTVTLTHC